MVDEHTGREMVSPADKIVDTRLGPLTNDQFRMMGQVPMGYEKAEWAQERVDIIRKRLAK